MGRYYTAQEFKNKFKEENEVMYANTILLARLTKDVELKYTPSGAAVGNVSVVVNEKFKDKQGNLQEKANFFNCTAWNKTAENINNFFKKGDMIFLACTPKQETYQDKDGNNRSSIKFNIDRFSFTGAKKDGATSTPAAQPQNYKVESDATFASDDIPF